MIIYTLYPMVLDLNISDIAQPVIREVNSNSWLKTSVLNLLDRFLERVLDRIVLKLKNTLDDSILKIEGAHVHLKELSPEAAKETLIDIKKAIKALDKEYVRLEEANFLDSDDVKIKYKYLLKAFYKSEAITHKIAYRKVKTLKTDDSIKNGIIAMNSRLLKKSI